VQGGTVRKKGDEEKRKSGNRNQTEDIHHQRCYRVYLDLRRCMPAEIKKNVREGAGEQACGPLRLGGGGMNKVGEAEGGYWSLGKRREKFERLETLGCRKS